MIRRVRAMVRKEWLEVWANWTMLGTLVIIPLVLLAVALGNLYVLRHLPPDAQTEALPPNILAMCGPLTGIDCITAYTGTIFQVVFLLLPVMIPSSIAAYGIIGEKTSHTLEPLLATPLRTAELIAAKLLGAVLPGIVVSWLTYATYVGAIAVTVPAPVWRQIATPAWALAVLLLVPLLGGLSTGVGLAVSSRVSDPRTAQQLAALIVAPIIATVFGQIFGVLSVTVPLVAAVAALLLIAEFVGLWLLIRLFQRESILTRWR